MVNHFTRHFGDPHQEKYRYGNQNIDASRTHLNYALFERDDPLAFIDSKIAELDKPLKRNANAMSVFVLTLTDDPRLAGREREYFETGCQFLCEQIGGEQNLVGAWVHCDESEKGRPHMHFAFCPMVETVVTTNDKTRPLRWTEADEKRNPAHRAGEVKRDKKGTVRYERVTVTDAEGNAVTKKSLAQSKMFDRAKLRNLHPALEAHMARHFGFEVGIQLADPGDKALSRLSFDEYVAAKATLEKTAEEVERLEDKREEIREQTAIEQHDLERLRHASSEAQERVAVMEAVAADCRAADASTLSGKSAIYSRIIARCNGFLERIGAAVDRAREAARRKLTIDVRHGGDEGASLHGRRGMVRDATAQTVHVPQRQMEKGYAPQL